MCHPLFNDKGVICLNFFASLSMWKKVVLKWLLTFLSLCDCLYILCTFKIYFRERFGWRLVTLSRFLLTVTIFPNVTAASEERVPGRSNPSSIVITQCFLKWMCSEIYDVLAYNFFWQAESVFKFLTALVEDVNICLQACSSLHALSSSLPDDLLQRYGLN